MSDDENELADHNHSPYRPCEDFDVTNKQRPRRQTFAGIVAVVDSTSSVLSEDVVIKPGVFNGSTLYDPEGRELVPTEGRELVPTDGRALEPAGVQLAILAGARLVWDACGCGGYCNDLEWPDRVALRKEAERSLPRFRKSDPVKVEVVTGSGGDVLFASGRIRWGDIFR